MFSLNLDFTGSAKKIIATALSTMIGLASFGSSAALAKEGLQLRLPSKLPTPRVVRRAQYEQDQLLVMPKKGQEKEEIAKALKNAHGTIINTIGSDDVKIFVIKTEPGKMLEAESKLSKDKHFAVVQRNYRYYPQALPPEDPRFLEQWYLDAVQAPKAWETTQGAGVKIAIVDSGCQASIVDLQGKTEKGFDATTPPATAAAVAQLAASMSPVPDPATETAAELAYGVALAASPGGQTDTHGHGTTVATVAAASTNTWRTLGVAPKATIYPVQGTRFGVGVLTEDCILAAVAHVMRSGVKIMNISYGTVPLINFNNPALHPMLHALFVDFYNKRNGLIFMSAGNDGVFDPTPRLAYLNMVSAIDSTGKLTDFSTYGNSITFTAPGQGLLCSDRFDKPASVQGTSFSSPIVAAIAALVWSANPGLSNKQVEAILKASCTSIAGGSQFYGYGLPNAEKAVKMALGQ